MVPTITITRQFDPATMFEQVMCQADIEAAALWATVERMRRLVPMVREQFERMQDAGDTLEICTEEQAAVVLQVEPQHLGNLRRKYGLAHMKFGDKVRYTREHLREICEFLTINKKERAALRKAA